MVRWDVDVDAFIQQVQNKQLLPESIVKELCEKTKEELVKEGNVRMVFCPVTLIGDVHGQFFDVLEIFRSGGFCPNTNYVFLGDYVDRGYYSVETITLLTCLKLRYLDRVALIRGNHESRAVTLTYFTDMFDYLVLSIMIDDAIFFVHGGMFSSSQLKIPHDGPMADLVWSDPISQPAGGPGQLPVPSATVADDNKGDFMVSPRGAGNMFGKEVARKAHQLCPEGYPILFDDMLSTVWSAPNYYYRAGNMASVLEIGPGLERFVNVFEPCSEQERDIAAYAVASGGTSPVE
ncbi:Metallo-dependent phosphatase [Cladochytrium replicatum]|nr:Metallo-dependent phosphatase [Cladochytrium replicatum]